MNSAFGKVCFNELYFLKKGCFIVLPAIIGLHSTFAFWNEPIYFFTSSFLTITGVAKRLKKELPNIKIIGADPVGSILGGGDEISSYLVEGIGYDFIPEVLDNSLIDHSFLRKE